jgi:hypothetical protein
MKSSFFTTTLFLGSLTILAGCGSSGGNSDTSQTGNGKGLPSVVQSAIDGPASTLSQELTNTLSYMGNEERLAYDVYNYLYSLFGTTVFTNIANNSEYKHISAVQLLVRKYNLDDTVAFTNVDLPALGYKDASIESMQSGTYDISTIQQLYDELTSQGSRSEIDALNVGCIIEVVDINDLNAYLQIAQNENASDVVTVFNFLRSGSYNHYWAFDQALKDKGVSNGCCSIGTAYCHPEYPKK